MADKSGFVSTRRARHPECQVLKCLQDQYAVYDLPNVFNLSSSLDQPPCEYSLSDLFLRVCKV